VSERAAAGAAGRGGRGQWKTPRRTRLGAAQPISAERTVIAASAETAPMKTCFRGLRIAITAAMKKVLSPISEASMTPQDLKKPSMKRLGGILGESRRSERAEVGACAAGRGGGGAGGGGG
jgi:hypothetical protein